MVKSTLLYPIPGTAGLQSLVYAFLAPLASKLPGDPVWQIVNYATDTFLIRWNDTGGPDDNHDDIMIMGQLTAVPIRGAAFIRWWAWDAGITSSPQRRSQSANV